MSYPTVRHTLLLLTSTIMDTVFTSAATATATSVAASTPTDMAAAAADSITPALAELIAKNSYVERIVEFGPYGYKPNLWLPLMFAGLYAASALTHVAQVALSRHWWLLLMVFACLAEAGGNGLRAYGHFEPREVRRKHG